MYNIKQVSSNKHLNYRESLTKEQEIDTNTIVDAVIKESRKEEIQYKIKAIESLGTILSSLDIDKFDDVHSIMQSVLSKQGEKDDDASSEEVSKSRENNIKLKEVLYDTLGKSWPEHSKTTQEKYREMFVDHCISCLPNETRSVQVYVMSALCCFVDKLSLLKEDKSSGAEEDALNKITERLLEALRYSLSECNKFDCLLLFVIDNVCFQKYLNIQDYERSR